MIMMVKPVLEKFLVKLQMTNKNKNKNKNYLKN